MLRERERVTEPLLKEKQAEVSAAPVSRPPETRASFSATNHDAVPEATAQTDSATGEPGGGGGCGGTDKPVTLPATGTGDIPDSITRDIVTRLRRWCHAVDAESAQDLMDEAADEIERLRIRDYERDAIEAAAESVKLDDDSNWTTLIELLERTK